MLLLKSYHGPRFPSFLGKPHCFIVIFQRALKEKNILSSLKELKELELGPRAEAPGAEASVVLFPALFPARKEMMTKWNSFLNVLLALL